MCINSLLHVSPKMCSWAWPPRCAKCFDTWGSVILCHLQCMKNKNDIERSLLLQELHLNDGGFQRYFWLSVAQLGNLLYSNSPGREKKNKIKLDDLFVVSIQIRKKSKFWTRTISLSSCWFWTPPVDHAIGQSWVPEWLMRQIFLTRVQIFKFWLYHAPKLCHDT